MVKKFTPEGVADINYEQYERLEALQSNISNVFKGHGYRQIQTPTFEYFDLFSGIDMDIHTDQMYKIVDTGGKMMVLRPDATIPVARMVATNYKMLKNDLKFMYFTNVYRSSDYHAGEKREFAQAGIELFGNPSADADAQVINIAIEAVKTAGFPELKVELGDSNYFTGLIEEIDAGLGAGGLALLDKSTKAKLKDLIESKNIPGLKNLTDTLEVDDGLKEIILRLPMMYGDMDSILLEARETALNDKMRSAVENIGMIYDKVRDRKYISADMGLVNQPDYYSGIIFKIYINNTGVTVGSGGRYDGLMEHFGKNIPATGFGLNVDILFDALEKEAESDKDGNDILTIALGKGRLAETTIEKLAAIGVEFPEYSKKSRKLIFDDSTGKVRIILVKAVDVGIYVEKGACDIGVIGKDTLMESKSDVYETLDLGYGRCIFAVAGLKGFEFDKQKKIRVATKYPNVAKAYFESVGRSIEIIKINGSVELAPIVGLSDIIVDLVETGATLRENGLEVVEKIDDISARFIVNRVSAKTKQSAVGEIMEALREDIRNEDN